MKANKADATLECENFEESEECEEVTLEVKGFGSSLDVGEAVIGFVLAFVSFLGVEC